MMGSIMRFYGLDVITSRVAMDPHKYRFKDKEEATWAAHMAYTVLDLRHRITLLPKDAEDHYVISVAVNMHNVNTNPRTYEYKGWMVRLEHQTNLKYLFDEHT